MKKNILPKGYNTWLAFAYSIKDIHHFNVDDKHSFWTQEFKANGDDIPGLHEFDTDYILARAMEEMLEILPKHKDDFYELRRLAHRGFRETCSFDTDFPPGYEFVENLIKKLHR